MDARGGTITWYLTANDADFNAAMARSRREARRTGQAIDRDFSKGMKSAQLSLDDFRRDLGRSAQLFRDFQIALRGFQMTSLIIGAATAGGAIIELAGALTAATQAILVLPSVITTGIGALATFKTAIYGIDDAFKALLKGDMEKLAEELAKLSPSAQEFVKSFGRINEAFKPIRTAVQEAFFQQLGEQMESVAQVTLPVLRTGMLQVATAMNGVAKEAARVVKEPFFQSFLSDSLKTTATSTTILTKAVEPLAQSIAGLVKVGNPFTVMLSQWIVDLSKSASLYINSAEGQNQLTDAINVGIDALQTLGSLIGSVFDLFVALFKVSNKEGLSLVGTLTDLIDRTTDWVNSIEGQELLTALFEATNTIFLELAETAGRFALALLEIIKAYNDLPDPIKNVVTDMIVWSALMSPLITYASSLAASWRLVYFGVREALQAVNIIILRLVALKTGLTAIEISQSSLSSFDKLKLAGEGIIQSFSRVGALLRGEFNSAIISVYATFLRLSTGGGILGTVLSGIATAARVAWAAITGPVGLVILAITAIVAGFVWLYNNVEGFRDFVNGVWSSIIGAAKTAGEWFSGPFVRFFQDAWASITSGVNSVRETMTNVWDGAVEAAKPVVDAFKTVGEAISSGFSGAVDVVVGVFNSVAGAVSTVITVLTPLWQIIGLVGHAIFAFGQIVFTVFSSAVQIIVTIVSTLVQIIGVVLYGTFLKLVEGVKFAFDAIVAAVTFVLPIIVGAVTSAFNSISEFVGSVIATIRDTIIAGWNAVVEFVTPILNTIRDTVASVFNQIKEIITVVFDAIWTFIQPTVTAVVNFLADRWNNLVANVKFAFELVKRYIIEPIAEVVGYVGARIGQIATFIGKAVTDSYNAVAGFVGRFVSAGHDIINGIVRGLQGGSGSVVQKIKDICANALDSVKSFFGIKSPSRVMAQMGVYIMQGLGIGIEREEDSLVKTAESAAASVLDAFSGISASIGAMDSSYSVEGNMTSAMELTSTSFAPMSVDSDADTIGTNGVTVNQTNNVYTELDMDQVNRNLTWELNKI